MTFREAISISKERRSTGKVKGKVQAKGKNST
jgi:hypothetical protein